MLTKDSFRYYLQSVSKYKVLDKESEYLYGMRVQEMMEVVELRRKNNSDEQICEKLGITQSELKKKIARGKHAKDKMVVHNIKLVVSIAKKYYKPTLNIDDLVQEGTIGLNRAVEKFKPQLGYKFSTYATWWIKQSVKRSALSDRTIKVPMHIHEKLGKIRSAAYELQKRNKRQPTTEEIAKELGWSEKEIKAIRDIKPTLSLDFWFTNDDEQTLLLDIVEDERLKELKETAELREQLDTLIERLEPLEAKIIKLKYGLDREKPASLVYIARELGMRTEQVKRAEQKILNKLKSIVDENYV